MGLAVGNVILASDFAMIKARVKAECLRRKYVGSVEEYGSAAYDYTVAPSDGNPVLTEHWNKIVVPMNKILDTGYSEVKVGDPVISLAGLSTKLSTLESESVSGDVSSCKASCTGLCKGSCSSGCTGCSGGCANSCAGNCTGGCSGCSSCSGSCVGGCHTDACKGGCSSGCQNLCKTTCKGTCKEGAQ